MAKPEMIAYMSKRIKALAGFLWICMCILFLSEMTFADSAKPNFLKNGYYYVQSAANRDLVWDINKAGMKSGGIVRLGKKKNTQTQLFYFEHVKDGCYRIRSAYSILYLQKQTKDTSAYVVQGKKTDQNAGLWKLWRTPLKPTNYIRLESLASGYLRTYKASPGEGDTIYTASDATYATQEFWYAVSASEVKFQLKIDPFKEPDKSYYTSDKLLTEGDVSATAPVKKIQFCVYDLFDKKLLTDSASPNMDQFDFQSAISLSKLSPGAYYYQINATSTAGQKWKSSKYGFVVKKKKYSKKKGTYIIESALQKKMVLDAENNGKADGTNIQLWTANGGANQSFQIKKVSGEWHEIIDVNSGKALDVEGGKKKKASNVRLSKKKRNDAQLWRFRASNGGYFFLENKLGYVLEVNGGKAEEGANVWVDRSKKTNAQRWKLKKTSKLRLVDATVPGDMQVGDSFGIRGKVKSDYLIKTITLGFYDDQGNPVSEKTVHPVALSYDISKLDYKVYLPDKAGIYEYRVVASDLLKKKAVLLKHSFWFIDPPRSMNRKSNG